MIFDVMSEREALRFAADTDILPCVLISIRNPEDGALVFPKNEAIRAVLHLSFYDTEEEEADAFSDGDAERVADFVLSRLDEVEEIVLHCHEGVSRSAGICAALMRELNGSDDEILRDRRYRPNRRCYEKMRAALLRRRGGG